MLLRIRPGTARKANNLTTIGEPFLVKVVYSTAHNPTGLRPVKGRALHCFPPFSQMRSLEIVSSALHTTIMSSNDKKTQNTVFQISQAIILHNNGN
jgi:hypothetical protein